MARRLWKWRNNLRRNTTKTIDEPQNMGKAESPFAFFQSRLLSETTKRRSETIIVAIAMFSFIVHLLIIGLVDLGVLHFKADELLTNPIAAIYTPFSFILIYEVYLLVYYLPKSTSTYIGKQYEIIALIIIRRIFKDLSELKFTLDWFNNNKDIQFSYDLVAIVILFILILVFYKLNEKKETEVKGELSTEVTRFIKTKYVVAMCLIPVFLSLATFSLIRWIYESFFSIAQAVDSIKDINKIFFDDFFTILILIDVLLLLFSFLHTDKFSKVIRNSGFIISTILIKLSFGAEGILNTILVVVAVLFGVIMLSVHNQYEKMTVPVST